jgi:cholesterol oxidase
MTFFRHLTCLSGVGVGGGSLVYANTLPTPGARFFRAPGWGELADWEEELEPHYATARRMLGATENPLETVHDRALKAVADKMGRAEHFRSAPVGIWFGEEGVTVPDPYHGGEGPVRTGCVKCGGCMTGCRHGSKNTLDTNYLWLAEKRGAEVRPDTEVTWIRPFPRVPGDAGSNGARYEVLAREGAGVLRRGTKAYQAKNVVLAGGVLGTVELLLRMQREPEGLPSLSPRTGDRIRTNSEVLIGVTSLLPDVDMSHGVSITSAFQSDESSSVEPVRFSSGSGFLRVLCLPHAPGTHTLSRLLNAAVRVLRRPLHTLRALTVRDWAKRTSILLYMRTQEGFLRFRVGRKVTGFLRGGLTSQARDGPVPTAALPEATRLADDYAGELNGYVGSLMSESLFGIPTTAHVLGGACMGRRKEEGVIDHRHRVFEYPGLYVIDGSAVSANPGVNPALTITALAERAMSFIPDKGPELGPTAGPDSPPPEGEVPGP